MGRSFRLVAGALVAVSSTAALHAQATPALHAEVTWRGECEDPESLSAELRARGAELREPTANARSLALSVDVRRLAADQLFADIELAESGWRERRRVEARECVALRRAVAWVLGVLAQEHEAATQRPPEPASGAFPATPSATPEAAPPVADAVRPATPPSRPVSRPSARVGPCAPASPRFQLDTELVAALGLVDALALGPALTARVRPCAGYWPGFSVGAAHLVHVGYDLNRRSVTLKRTSAQLGAWVPVGASRLRGGLLMEVGRIHASGAASEGGPGGSSSAPWFALVTPWRWSQPLLGQSLSAELGLDLAYTPLSYRLRLASEAEPLARPAHFELRGGLGVAGRF